MTSYKIENDAINHFYAKETCFGKFQGHSLSPDLRNWEVLLKCQLIGLQSLTIFQNESLTHAQKLQGVYFWTKGVSKEILLTGPKFHCNTTSASGIIKKFRSGGCALEGLRSEYKVQSLSTRGATWTTFRQKCVLVP